MVRKPPNQHFKEGTSSYGLLEQWKAMNLVFDDDPDPTPADVVDQVRAGKATFDECAEALTAVLSKHQEELDWFVEFFDAQRLDLLVDTILRMRNKKAASAIRTLRNISTCLLRLEREEESLQLADKALALELERGREHYQAKIEKHPRDAQHFNDFGMFLKNYCKDYEQAEKHYLKAIQLRPDDAIFLNNMGVILMNPLGRYDEAEDYFRKSLEQKPNNSNTLANLACLLHNFQNKDDEAKRLYLKALELDPLDASAGANYASMLICEDRWSEANEQLQASWDGGQSKNDRIGARILFLQTGLSLLWDRNPAEYSEKLKNLIARGIAHSPWSAVAVIKYFQEKLPENDASFLVAIYAAITDWSSVDALKELPRWTD